jgi:hypothetical protein
MNTLTLDTQKVIASFLHGFDVLNWVKEMQGTEAEVPLSIFIEHSILGESINHDRITIDNPESFLNLPHDQEETRSLLLCRLADPTLRAPDIVV